MLCICGLKIEFILLMFRGINLSSNGAVYLRKRHFMRKLILFILSLFVSTAVLAQDYDETVRPINKVKVKKQKSRSCSNLYFDVSTGLNNNAGLLGVGVDGHVSDDLSFNGGIGLLTTWGYKLYAGGKYYFNSCHHGWAIGGGLTYSTGVQDSEPTLETIYGTHEQVRLHLLAQANFFIAAYKYWNLGGRNRIYLELGYSAPLTTDKYTQTGGSPISHNSSDILHLLSPGGLIVGLGFSFGTGRH
jgi:hypothetical protein